LLFAAGSLLLWTLSTQQAPALAGIYLAVALMGAARSLAGPAGQALVPNLIPVQHFPNAIAWSSSIWQLASVLGPALGGIVYGWSGKASVVYAVTTVLELSATGFYLALRTRSVQRSSESRYWSRVSAGIRYIWQHKPILGALSLDLFAVLFGGAVALLPVFARDILHVGPTGLGWLRSAPACGAVVMALLLAARPIQRGAGVILLSCVAVFGLCMMGFGLSRTFWLSMLFLAIAGAVDMVSIVMRHTLVQLNTPDSMRGRVGAVSLIFVGASNELGEFESGVAAAVFGTVASVVLGGGATIAVVLIWAWLFPSLRRVDRLAQAPPAS
jgi:hypothetical protein